MERPMSQQYTSWSHGTGCSSMSGLVTNNYSSFDIQQVKMGLDSVARGPSQTSTAPSPSSSSHSADKTRLDDLVSKILDEGHFRGNGFLTASLPANDEYSAFDGSNLQFDNVWSSGYDNEADNVSVSETCNRDGNKIGNYYGLTDGNDFGSSNKMVLSVLDHGASYYHAFNPRRIV